MGGDLLTGPWQGSLESKWPWSSCKDPQSLGPSSSTRHEDPWGSSWSSWELELQRKQGVVICHYTNVAKMGKSNEPITEFFYLRVSQRWLQAPLQEIGEQTQNNQDVSWFREGICTFIVYALGGEEATCRSASGEEQEQHQGGSNSKNNPHRQCSASPGPPRQQVFRSFFLAQTCKGARVRPRRGRSMRPVWLPTEPNCQWQWRKAEGKGARCLSALSLWGPVSSSKQMTQKKMPVFRPQASRSTKGGARGEQPCLPPEPAWDRKLQQRRQENSSSSPFVFLGPVKSGTGLWKTVTVCLFNLRWLG
jgi:hypothetical protein